MTVIITGNNTPTAGGVTYGDGTTYVNTAAGTAGQFLQSAGSGAPIWAAAGSSVVRSTKTANYTLVAGDKGNLVVATANTFTFAFTAAATLGAGWFVYLQNSGTGDITLDPLNSETIDGLTSYIMYPGEVRLVQCTGTAFTSIVISPFSRTFTTSGTFTKPPGYQVFSGLIWSGGASGQKAGAGATGRGGGGGGCGNFTIFASTVGVTETVTIAAGGAAVTGIATGNLGGNSSLGSLVNVYAGLTFIEGGSVMQGAVCDNSTLVANYEGANSTATSPITIFGGGANPANSNASPSWYGGGCGGTIFQNGTTLWTPGTSKYGGSGGAASSASDGTAGTAPGGGGGGTQTGAQSGAGARGQLSIWGAI